MEIRHGSGSRLGGKIICFQIGEGGLLIGSIPLFLGLIIVMPVLGHAAWHLYHKVAPR
jgi:uncharacterized membrane protein